MASLHLLQRLLERLAASRAARLSYAQEGEDLILETLFASKLDGFYVDVGAHHPWRFSNTARLALRGWRGINIDPEPGSMASFHAARPRDINLEVAVGAAPGTRRFFRYSEPALNGFEDRAVELSGTPYRALGAIEVPVRPLRDILAEHAPSSGAIDLLSIDVEGAELEVLQSNDWSRWAPAIVLIEVRRMDVRSLLEHPPIRLLADLGYEIAARTARNVLLSHASTSGGSGSPAAPSSERK